jgi:hypothetical protein
MEQNPKSSLELIKTKHKALALGLALGEQIETLCLRLDFPLLSAQRLAASPTFLHLVDGLRGLHSKA